MIRTVVMIFKFATWASGLSLRGGQLSVISMVYDNNRSNQLNPNNNEYHRSRNLGTKVIPRSSQAARKHLVDNWDNKVGCASVGDASYILLWPGGATAWYNIPKQLDDKLRGRQKSHSMPNYVTLGPDDSTYFVSFADGSSQWSSHGDDFSKFIKSRKADVSVVAFAPNGGYFVLFDDDDDWEYYNLPRWEYYNLPRSMDNFLTSNQHRLSSVCGMSISADEGWFVSFTDGKHPQWKCGPTNDNVEDTLLETFIEINQDEKLAICSVDFGAHGNWLLRYQ